MKYIPLTKGQFAIVDDSDFDVLNQFKWHALKKKGIWYARRAVYDSTTQKDFGLYMHRSILKPPKGLVVDHKNGNGLDNRRLNLRLASRSQNQANYRSLSSRNKSGYHGVYYHNNARKKRPWAACIRVDGKTYHLGFFHDPKEAAIVRDRAAIEHFGEFAFLNFPEEVEVST